MKTNFRYCDIDVTCQLHIIIIFMCGKSFLAIRKKSELMHQTWLYWYLDIFKLVN
jgi:hypothetical protein